MDTLFYGLGSMLDTSSGDSSITIMTVILAIVFALALSLIIAVTYIKTNANGICDRNFILTLVMIPPILGIIILLVSDNVARIFSLAGTVSIIRFRSAPGDPKDIAYILLCAAAGLAAGIGFYLYGALFIVLFCLILLVVSKVGFGKSVEAQRILKILIPEDLDYEGVFDDIMAQFTSHSKLAKVRTTDLGSIYELVYNVRIKSTESEKEFIDALRCRNGNLSIVLAMMPTEYSY